MESHQTTPTKQRNFFSRYKIALMACGGLLAALILVVILLLAKDSNQELSSSDNFNFETGDSSGIDWSNYPVYEVELSDTLDIKQAGVYRLSGKISDGNITIETDDNVKLILNNVTIVNTHGPAIFVRNAKNVVISTAKDTTNSLEDGTSYSGYEIDEVGTIFSHDDLFFDGEGTLNVTSKNEDAIVSKDDLEFISGAYNIAAADDAIRGKDSVHIVSGTFTINSTADAIKSTEDVDSEKGYVYIEGGKFNITAGDDAIHATTNLVIDQGEINIAKSYEGLEGTTVTINGGNIVVNSSDDGINAAGGNDGSSMNRPGANPFASNDNNYIRIRGGQITISAAGDGIDSNGNVYIDGGEITVYGPTNDGDGAFDYDGECVMTGGLLLAGGASGMAQGISENSSINSINIFFGSNYGSGDKITLLDENNQEVTSYNSSKTYNSLVIASSKLELNHSYTIQVNGATYKTLTLSDSITQIGTAGMGVPGGQMHGDPNSRGQDRAPGNMPR